MTKAESAASRTPRTDLATFTTRELNQMRRGLCANEYDAGELRYVKPEFARALELEAADLREQLSVSERNLAYAAKEITDLREQLAAEIANRRDGHRLLIEERGVRDVCNDCDGLGTKSYGSTATWRGGVGGQAFTTDVCNKCWGSGDSGRKWPSHSEIQSLRERLAKAREEARNQARESLSVIEAILKSLTHPTPPTATEWVEIRGIARAHLATIEAQKGADHE